MSCHDCLQPDEVSRMVNLTKEEKEKELPTKTAKEVNIITIN